MADLWQYDEPIRSYQETRGCRHCGQPIMPGIIWQHRDFSSTCPAEFQADGPRYAAPVDPIIPRWIDQDTTPADVAAILQGGCDSGAYMPAVTYHQALATMNEHGDAILDYLDEAPGDMTIPEDLSWAGLACWYVSRAVELWAANVESELSDLLDGIEEGEGRLTPAAADAPG